MFYSAMTVSAAKQISLFTKGSHLRDKSLNVGFGGGGGGGGDEEGQHLCHTKWGWVGAHWCVGGGAHK